MTEKLEQEMKKAFKEGGFSGLENFIRYVGTTPRLVYTSLKGDSLNDKVSNLISKWGEEVKSDSLSSVESLDKELTDSFNSIAGNTTAGVEDLKERLGYTQEPATDSKHAGLRFNEGKPRFDLIHPWANEQMVNVLTVGANKYSHRNWENGMAWTTVVASLKRHLNAFEKGEDYDPETGELHMAHIACNAHFLTAYYKIYPQGDDRPHNYLKNVKIGLDIDEVIADWVGAWTEKYGMTTPEFWNFDTNIVEKFAMVKDDKEFWMGIKPKIDPKDLPFEPHCYITSRIIPTEWTQEWLEKNGFPTMPVHTIGHNESKVKIAQDAGIDIFVDDRYENFVELNRAGICTFLMDAPHNRRYEVGFKRITNLKQIV